jgi:hypothetical protein
MYKRKHYISWPGSYRANMLFQHLIYDSLFIYDLFICMFL